MLKILFKIFLVLLLLSGVDIPVFAQAQKAPADLKATIASLDSALFDAYNKCELEKFESFFSDDVEFYHDQGGIMRGKQALVEASRKNICGKVNRRLMKETLEVYPISNYGAIEYGQHQFKNIAQGDKEFGRPAKFLHIWHLKDGVWKISRVVSYDH